MESKSKWKKRGKWLAITAIVGYVSVCAIMYFAQEFLLFHPTVVSADAPWDLTMKNGVGLESSVEELNFPSELGGMVNALHFKLDTAKGAVLFFHGNSGNVGRCAHQRNGVLERGWEFFMADYRGYGKSTGDITQAGMDADVEAAWLELRKRYPADRIVIFGQSMGSGFATRLASRHTPRALILEAPYTSLADVGASQYPWLPVHWLMKYPSEALPAMQSVQCPVFIIHGTDDRVIPYSQGEAMAKAANKGNLFTCPGAGHNGLPETPQYGQMLDQALR